MTTLIRDHGGTATKDRFSVCCLGPFTVQVGDQRIESWRPRKARALFQYLVNHHDRPVPREALMEALWSDPDAIAPATSLKVTVHTLRQLFSRLGEDAPALVLDREQAGYRLEADNLWLDVEEFEGCCQRGRRLLHQGEVDEGMDCYRRAADLYRGDFLPDAWEDWVVFRRERLKDQYLFVLAHLADAALRAGDDEECILRCQQLLEEDRCREDTYRRLMLCHARLGQRERVRRWYDLCVRTLRSELDAAPERQTEELYQRAMGGHTLTAA